MSNSKLVNYTKLSPNYNKRNRKIDTITIHHMSGNLSVETCGNVFASASRQASSNYGIDSNGRVGLYVDEANRSWCSSSPANDHRAVTIEVANDKCYGDWHVSDKALAKLIDLCVDICQRNDIKKLNYTGNTSGNLTMHQWFIATDCPGPYLKSKFPYIAEEVNKRLGATTSTSTSTSTTTTKPVATNKKVDITYKVATAATGWLPEVKNLEDYAGYGNNAITKLAIKVSEGVVKYRVHVKGGKWLGWITKYDVKDDMYGYAGNGQPIDAIQVYYQTPDSIRPYKRAKYRVAPGNNANYWDWQYDNETTNGQDGYAGYFGKALTKIQMTIV